MQVITREQLTFNWLMNEGNYKNKNILIVGRPKSGRGVLGRLLNRNHSVNETTRYTDRDILINDITAESDSYKILHLTVNKASGYLDNEMSELLKDWLVINLD